MAKNNKHIHKYRKTDIGAKGREYLVMQCAMPGCGHYLPHLNLAIGRESICWRCEDTFVMDVDHLSQANPHCNNCKRTEDDARRTQSIA